MNRDSIFAVTENGKTRYLKTNTYGGLAGIAARLCLNSHDESGTVRPLFKRLDRTIGISGEHWQRIADAPDLSDRYFSFIEIDADKNTVRVDEDWRQERRYVEVPLDKLLETAAPLVTKGRYSGCPMIEKAQLYRALQQHFDPKHGIRFPEAEEKPSVLKQIRAGRPPSEKNTPRGRKRAEIDL